MMDTLPSDTSAAQVAPARQAAATKAANSETTRRRSLRAMADGLPSAPTPPASAANKRVASADVHSHGARAPPRVRLLDKAEVMAIANVTFPTIWIWMRRGVFPRARIAGGKSMWLSSEVQAWLEALPVCKLKGDAK